MNIALGTEAETIIREKLKHGQYATAEDVVLAALRALDRTPDPDFAPGELDELLAQGEHSIRSEGTVDADEVFEELRQLSARYRSKSE